MINNEELKWIGVDLDNTLADNSGTPDFILEDPIEGAKDFMDELVNRGFRPVIYTARHWADYEIIENWLIKHDIPFREIICGKPLFYKIVDDKNIAFKGDYKEVLKEI